MFPEGSVPDFVNSDPCSRDDPLLSRPGALATSPAGRGGQRTWFAMRNGTRTIGEETMSDERVIFLRTTQAAMA